MRNLNSINMHDQDIILLSRLEDYRNRLKKNEKNSELCLKAISGSDKCPTIPNTFIFTKARKTITTIFENGCVYEANRN